MSPAGLLSVVGVVAALLAVLDRGPLVPHPPSTAAEISAAAVTAKARVAFVMASLQGAVH